MADPTVANALALIPEGWRCDTGRPDSFWIAAPSPRGGITVDVKRRQWSWGFNTTPNPEATRFVGRGWFARLVGDAVRALQEEKL